MIVVSVHTLYIDKDVRAYNVENMRADLIVVVVGAAKADEGEQLAQESLKVVVYSVIWFAIVSEWGDRIMLSVSSLIMV